MTIVVTSAAGALTDVLTRAVSQRLSQMWGQSIVVENRGGAGHNLAANAVKAAPADGYTLLASETGFVTSQPHLYAKGKLSYDAETDFIPVAGYAGIPIGLLVHPSVPAKSVAELIALAKEKPGAVTYGTAGVGTALHTAALLLESLAGIKMTAVHYRGAAPALNDLIAGHINMITMGPSVALPAVKDGKLNMLGFGSEQRVRAVSRRADHRRDRSGLRGEPYRSACSRRSGTPREILVKINADVQKIIHEPEFHKTIPRAAGGAADTRFAGGIRRISAEGLRQMGQGHQGGQPEDRLRLECRPVRRPCRSLRRLPASASRARPIPPGPSPSWCRPRRAA